MGEMGSVKTVNLESLGSLVRRYQRFTERLTSFVIIGLIGALTLDGRDG